MEVNYLIEIIESRNFDMEAFKTLENKIKKKDFSNSADALQAKLEPDYKSKKFFFLILYERESLELAYGIFKKIKDVVEEEIFFDLQLNMPVCYL